MQSLDASLALCRSCLQDCYHGCNTRTSPPKMCFIRLNGWVACDAAVPRIRDETLSEEKTYMRFSRAFDGDANNARFDKIDLP